MARPWASMLLDPVDSSGSAPPLASLRGLLIISLAEMASTVPLNGGP